MIKAGLSREIDENDIYAVTNSMRSEENTQAFAKQWQIELDKKRPSIIRVMLKIYGLKIFILCFIYSIGLTLARLILMEICSLIFLLNLIFSMIESISVFLD